jgi:hypothetical protein
VNAPAWNELRADGRVVVGAPARKLAIYPNADGAVILMSVDNGVTSFVEVCPGEFIRLAEELSRAMSEARRIATTKDAEYVAHLLIERARG